jgi:[FeFe] hydrogenase H-cluster maturation GTPase HydF
MEKTPKSLRLQIGIFGRTNVGKSSFLNMITAQDVAITSATPGTTTDVVEKAMELLPIGPIMFLDTAGTDDKTELGVERIKRTKKIYKRADVALLVAESNFGEYEEEIIKSAKEANIPLITIINKTDLSSPSQDFLDKISENGPTVLTTSTDKTLQDSQLHKFKQALISVLPEEFIKPLPLIGDLLPSGGHAIFIVPIDLQAPKGRLILPQVQAIRDVLDSDAIVSVVKEREYRYFLENLKRAPDLVVCDSQVVQKMVADTPPNIKVTTFSTLFARFKGELLELVRGVAAIEKLEDGDKILIAEACSHHAMEDDIGRVKIPRWLRQYVGGDLDIDIYSGRDFPDNLSDYKVVIHCGSCMLTRREMLMRIDAAKGEFIPITNYGLTISFIQGVFKRIITPFPAALELYENEVM